MRVTMGVIVAHVVAVEVECVCSMTFVVIVVIVVTTLCIRPPQMRSVDGSCSGLVFAWALVCVCGVLMNRGKRRGQSRKRSKKGHTTKKKEKKKKKKKEKEKTAGAERKT